MMPEPVRPLLPGSQSFVISLGAFFDHPPNLDLCGPGTLTIVEAEPRFVFTGRTRDLLSRRQVTRAFTSEQIRDVFVAGRRIEFTFSAMGAAGHRTRFFFLCPTPEEAAVVAALLPATRDPETQDAFDFNAKLRALPAPESIFGRVTLLLIGVNLAVFVAMGFAGAGWIKAETLQPYIVFGASHGAPVAEGQWWRLLTCMFLHYGIVHLALNMWALFHVGRLLERLLGRGLFTLVYFGSGLAGSFASVYWNGDRVWSVGASGAVFGVFGATLGYLLREKQTIPRGVLRAQAQSAIFFAGYNVLFGFIVRGIDNAAHIGGFLGGLILGWLCAMPLDPALRAARFRRGLRVGLATIATLLVAGLSGLPRYDYRYTEELAWTELVLPFVEREKSLRKSERLLLDDVVAGRQSADTLAWLRTEALPYYSALRRELSLLKTTPGLRTAIRQERYDDILERKIAAYRALTEGIAAGRTDAVGEFAAEKRALELAERELVKALAK